MNSGPYLMLKRLIVLLLCLLTSSLCAQSAGTAPVWPLIGPPFTANPQELRAAAAPVPVPPYADATVLLEQDRYRLSADGKVTHVHELTYRIETKAGIESWDQTSAEWDPWFQSQPTIRARVIQTDGRVTELDPTTLTDVPAKNEDEGTLSDARIRKGPLPALTIGAIVEEQTTLVDKLPYFSGGNIYRAYFSRSVPVVRSLVIVEFPAALPLQTRIHELPDSVAHAEQEGELRRITFDVVNVPQSLSSDIDLYTDKPRHPYVEFSTGSSWASVAAAYSTLAEPQIQVASVQTMLPASGSARMATIQAIVARLHREVRYTGVEFGESALRPQNPAEVLKRHYGDCKDKAAMLVAMLRAAGIPANLALLDTGPGLDVNPDLPGMSQFDHAIAHLPADSGQPELWIDATAQFTKVGDLPYADQGRLALIIADGTTSLTRIPGAKPADNVLTETREVTLAQIGPSHIVEASATTGHVDADYRSHYGATESKEIKEDLDRYSKRTYLAKALTHTEHGDGADLTKPFTLKLVMDKATRGNSSLSDAVVAIPPSAALSRLPSWFSDDPEVGVDKLSAEQKEDRKKAEQQRSSEYLVHPFITEICYRIVVPEGFFPHALPEDQTLHLGPAILTRHFVTESPSLVIGTYHFDTVRERYSIDEILALRKAVIELDRQNYSLVLFDQAGAKLLADGKIRQALEADRSLMAARPTQSMHHVQMASVLLAAGLGEEAQAEARKASRLDPTSSAAFLELGQTLERNSIGVEHGRGFDRKGAIQAYLTAKKLEPDDLEVRTTLALLYEHNADGERYTEGSNLTDAIREYRELKTVDNDTYIRYQDNLFYCMLYHRDFAALLTELATLPMNPTREGLAIAATTATQSVQAGLQRSEHVGGDAKMKSTALSLAGFQLVRLGLYTQAAELLTASLQGQQDAAQVSRQADLFRTLRHAEPEAFPATDPRQPVQRLFNATLSGTLQKDLPTFLSRHSYADDAEWKRNLEHNDAAGILVLVSKQAQLPSSVMRDVILNNLKYNVQGDDDIGYRVSMQTLGSPAQNLFVSKDIGQYMIVADGPDNSEVGNYVLYLLKSNREAEARNLLDWKRDRVHRGGGDDPLSGDLFARFWTIGAASTSDAMRIAALALTLQKQSSQAPLEPALAAYTKAPADPDLTLLLASAYLNHRDAANAKIYVDKLLTQHPNSVTAIALAGDVDNLTHNYTAWRALLSDRLARHTDDYELLQRSAWEAQAESDFGRARQIFQQILDSGKATATDYNAIAWLGLFDNHVDAKAIDAGRQANLLSKNSSFGDLHTLACLYAAQGKTTEARQILLQAMAVANKPEPDSATWFGFGSIYEQFGADDAAIVAYHKVAKPDSEPINPVDTWSLAQARLKALHAQ